MFEKNFLHPVFDAVHGVIFDKDGTLLDHHATWVEATKTFGVIAAGGNVCLAKRLLKEQKFDWDTEQFDGGDGIAGNTWEVTIECFRKSMLRSGEDTSHLADAHHYIMTSPDTVNPVPLPGVHALISTLISSGVKVGLATNDAEASARDHLQRLGLISAFGAVVGADSGFGGKPDPGMIIGCAHLMGLKAQDVIMVGDTDRDTLAGSAAGCRAVVGVLNGNAISTSMKASATLILPETRNLLVR